MATSSWRTNAPPASPWIRRQGGGGRGGPSREHFGRRYVGSRRRGDGTVAYLLSFVLACVLLLLLTVVGWQVRLILTFRPDAGRPSPGRNIGGGRNATKGSSSRRHRGSDLSLGILTHLRTAYSSGDWIENQVMSLTEGRDSSKFRDVFVFYDTTDFPVNYMNSSVGDVAADGSGLLGEWIRFSEKMKILRSRGLVSKYIPLKRNSSVPAAVGSRDGRMRDNAVYAIYQLMMEECLTTSCAFLTQDIMANGGGGLRHAVRALEDDKSLVFAIPPTARLQHVIHLLEEGDSLLWRIQPLTRERLGREENDSRGAQCMTQGSSLSTRYFVANRKRFARAIPFAPVSESDAWFENHKGVAKFTVSTRCLPSVSAGYLIHPPPWQMGKRLFEACGSIGTLQRVVDRPDFLLVDIHNNMVERNWTAACRSLLSGDEGA